MRSQRIFTTMKQLSFIIRLLALSALFVIGAFANTVSLDTSFNGTGYSIRPAVPLPDWSLGWAFALQPDGKIVIGGDTVHNQQPDRFALMRLNGDGSLDTSFGTGGSVSTLVDVSNGASDLQLQPDGKILLCGGSWREGTADNMTILRYTAAGALDTSFNGTGYRTININGDSSEYCGAMALLPDGKILMTGSTSANLGGQSDIVMARLNADGSLDTTFNGSGILTIVDPNLNEGAGPIILLADGKFILGGYRYNGANANFLLMRFNADGTPDTSFGTGGATVTVPGSGSNFIGSIDRQSDGKIVAGGSGYLVRYTANGALDPTFGTGGVSRVQAEMGRIRVAGDDKILVAEKFGANAGVVRFTVNGAVDTNFNGGAANIFTPGFSCVAGSVAVQPDNKILFSGYCTSNGSPRFAVWRVKETRTKRFLDFNGDGGTDMSIYRPSNGQWWYLDSSNLFTQTVAAQFGLATDRPVPADFTGDGRTDVAVFRPSTGEWFVLRSENNTFYSFPFGTSGDIPIAADYDGDDLADVAVFRPSTNEWYIQKSTGGLVIATFGTAGDKPVPSDYDGDFKTDIAIYRPSSGEWWISKSSDNSIYAFQFGTASDKVVPGDYTGDNKTDAAFWRPSTGEWFILRSEDFSYYSIPFGLSDDLPTPGNYAGDGRFDLVVYRPSTNTWHVQPTGGAYFYRIFGAAGDQPLPNGFVP
jgi:uncharacterized delta-60 repeat protein